MTNQELLQNLMDAYTYQRQNGVEPQLALQTLAKMQPNLPPEDRQVVLQMVREWEVQRQQTETASSVQVCPQCGKKNPPKEAYCYSCGQMLGVSLATRKLEEEEPDRSLFGALTSLLVMVRSHAQRPINVAVEDAPLLIGRHVPGSETQPDIDLMPYDADTMGVSRIHASIQREKQTLTIVDKGSSNFTFINGEKLHPHEVRVIHDGDEVRFGRLTTIFIFKRELKKL